MFGGHPAGLYAKALIATLSSYCGFVGDGDPFGDAGCTRWLGVGAIWFGVPDGATDPLFVAPPSEFCEAAPPSVGPAPDVPAAPPAVPPAAPPVCANALPKAANESAVVNKTIFGSRIKLSSRW